MAPHQTFVKFKYLSISKRWKYWFHTYAVLVEE